jgi:hypothetical protein
MHVHSNQFDPNLMQMYALHAAAKTEAKREAERTRRKLTEAAWALGGEYDDADCVVRLSGDGGGEERSGGRGGQSQDGRRQDERAGAGSGEDLFSDWA